MLRSASALGLLGVAALAAVVALAPTPARGNSSGANPGFAGNRSDGGTPRTCVVCHSAFALNSGSGGVAVEAPATAEPGQTVRVVVTVDNQTPAASSGIPKRQGFQATVRDPETGALFGSFALPDPGAVQQVGSGTDLYVTHTSGGSAQTSWAFDWVVGPDEGTARIYVAGNAADGVGTAGDYIYTATADVAVAATAAAPRPEAAFALGDPRPHPARAGQPVRLGLDLDAPGPVAVRLADGLGRTVREVARGDRAAGPGVVSVVTDGLAPGTYFVVVEGPGGRRTRPLVVVR